jgi:hypothetical protein
LNNWACRYDLLVGNPDDPFCANRGLEQVHIGGRTRDKKRQITNVVPTRALYQSCGPEYVVLIGLAVENYVFHCQLIQGV